MLYPRLLRGGLLSLAQRNRLMRRKLKPTIPEAQTAIRPAAAPDAVPAEYSLVPWPLVAIMATAFVLLLPFFLFGIPSGHDFEFHLNTWMEVLRQWKHGIVYPRWADLANYGYGEPRMVFYPPASWMLGAALGALLPWVAVPGVYVWLVLTLSGCSMFWLARRWLARRDAIFAAALYAANPYHLLIVYWRSAYAELLAAALLPLLLLFVLRLEQEGRKLVVPLALIVAAAWLINAPSAVMVNYSLALLVVLVAVARRSPRILLHGVLAVLLGAALAAFYVVPATLEQPWVDISQALSEGVRPQDNFLFIVTTDPRHNQFNRLVSVVALAQMAVLAGAACYGRWQRLGPRAGWMVAAWAATAALFMFPVMSPLWQHLPKLRYMQFPWRWLLCMNVGFALLIAVTWRRWLPRLAVCGAMLAVVVFAGHRFQPPWWDDAPEIADLGQSVESGVGYEGTDEYTPVDADGYEISRDARRVTFQGKGNDQIHVLQWDPESKFFTAQVSTPGELVMRLFNYPAWRVEVNGQVVATDSQDLTGQMVIPVHAGENQVRITFTRTRDRTVGGIVSGVTLMFMLGVVAFERKGKAGPAAPFRSAAS